MLDLLVAFEDRFHQLHRHGEAVAVLAQARIEQEDRVLGERLFLGYLRQVGAEAGIEIERPARLVPAAGRLDRGIDGRGAEDHFALGRRVGPRLAERDTVVALFLAGAFRLESGVLAGTGVGLNGEAHLVELAFRQGEAIEHPRIADGQRLLVGEDDAVVSFRSDGEDPAAERVTGGVFEQGRIDALARDLLVDFESALLGDDARFLELSPVGGVDLPGQVGGGQQFGGNRLLAGHRDLWAEALRFPVARCTEEHRVIRRTGAGGQRILERAFELPVVWVAEDVIDECAGAGSLDDDADVQADQLQRVLVADVDAREGRPAGVAVPDGGGFGLWLRLGRSRPGGIGVLAVVGGFPLTRTSARTRPLPRTSARTRPLPRTSARTRRGQRHFVIALLLGLLFLSRPLPGRTVHWARVFSTPPSGTRRCISLRLRRSGDGIQTLVPFLGVYLLVFSAAASEQSNAGKQE